MKWRNVASIRETGGRYRAKNSAIYATALYYVAYALDIRGAREDIPEYNVHILHQMRKFSSSEAFRPSAKLQSAGEVDGAMQHLFQDFNFTRTEWNIEIDDGSRLPLWLAYGSMPVIYWIQKKKSLLRMFALRILCVRMSVVFICRAKLQCSEADPNVT